MSIFWQHAVIVVPSVSAVLVALLNRRTIKRVEVSLNGRIETIIAALEGKN